MGDWHGERVLPGATAMEAGMIDTWPDASLHIDVCSDATLWCTGPARREYASDTLSMIYKHRSVWATSLRK